MPSSYKCIKTWLGGNFRQFHATAISYLMLGATFWAVLGDQMILFFIMSKISDWTLAVPQQVYAWSLGVASSASHSPLPQPSSEGHVACLDRLLHVFSRDLTQTRFCSNSRNGTFWQREHTMTSVAIILLCVVVRWYIMFPLAHFLPRSSSLVYSGSFQDHTTSISQQLPCLSVCIVLIGRWMWLC